MREDERNLLDSMVEGFIEDVVYEFDLDQDSEAINMIKGSLKRMEPADEPAPF